MGGECGLIGFRINLKVKQSIFEHIGGYAVINELIDKAFAVLDAGLEDFIPSSELADAAGEEKGKVAIASKILKVIRSCFNVLSVMARGNEPRVYRRVAKTIFNYTHFNLGQVELLTNLFADTSALFGQMTHQDFAFFVDLIRLHGRYSEFLEFYDVLLASAERSSKNSDLHKTVLETLLDADQFLSLNVSHISYFPCYSKPFATDPPPAKPGFRRFYEHSPNPDKYKQKFLKVIDPSILTFPPNR